MTYMVVDDGTVVFIGNDRERVFRQLNRCRSVYRPEYQDRVRVVVSIDITEDEEGGPPYDQAVQDAEVIAGWDEAVRNSDQFEECIIEPLARLLAFVAKHPDRAEDLAEAIGLLQ